MVEFAAVGSVDEKVTVVEPVTATGEVSCSVFTSALVDARVQVATPDEFVAEQAPYTFPDPVFVALKIGVTPETGFRNESLREIVMNDTEIPSAETGLVPTISDLVGSALPATKVTVPPAFVKGPVILSVFVSAFVDFRVHVEIPDASVILQAP
jgi:hypothetical protein